MCIGSFRYGLVVRIAGSHPAGPGSIPGNGKYILSTPQVKKNISLCVMYIFTNTPNPKKEIKKIENWIFGNFYFSAKVTHSLRGLMDKASVS